MWASALVVEDCRVQRLGVKGCRSVAEWFVFHTEGPGSSPQHLRKGFQVEGDVNDLGMI